MNPPGPCVDRRRNPAGSTDAVDNCPYLRARTRSTPSPRAVARPARSRRSSASLTTDLSIGPYDPIYTYDTLLSNGTSTRVTRRCPPLRSTFRSRRTAGTPTDISGVGYLFPADKAVEKSRDQLGRHRPAHNLDQPFYSQYIPATDRPTNASGSPYDDGSQPTGITGTDGTGFSGFWWSTGPYENWEFAYDGTATTRTRTRNCL